MVNWGNMNNRRALLDAARSLVAVKGVKGTTIAQIATQAGVAKGLLFYYFKDKESIIQAIAEELDADYMAALQSKQKDLTALESLHQLFQYHFAFLEQVPEGVQFIYQSIAAPGSGSAIGFYEHLYMRILEILEEGVRCGEFILPNAEELAYMILGSLHGVGRLKLFDFKREYDAAKHLVAFYDKILLCQAPGNG